MTTFIKKGLYCALLVGGLSLIGISAANAAEAPSTTGADGIVSGSQVVTDLVAPITLTGNAISVLGDSSANQGAATPAASEAAPLGLAPTTTGADGIVSGTQAVLAADAPVTVSGNAISVVGDSSSTGSDTQTAAPAARPSTATTGPTTTGPTTTGADSVLGGTQVVPIITAPIVAENNAISVLGDSNSTGGASTAPTNAASTGTTSPSTTGADSVLGGTQVPTNLTAPVTVQGNAISVVGDSDSEGAINGATTPTSTSSVAPTTTGADSLLGGTQIVPLIAVPISLSGNAVSVVGDSDTGAPTTGTTTTTTTTTTSPTGTQPITRFDTDSASGATGTSSLAGLHVTPLSGSTLASSTLASTGTTPLPFLALGLLLALVGLGLVVRRGVRTI